MGNRQNSLAHNSCTQQAIVIKLKISSKYLIQYILGENQNAVVIDSINGGIHHTGMHAVVIDSINGGIHHTGMHACVHASMVYATNLLVWAPPFYGSSEIQRFEHSDAFEIRKMLSIIARHHYIHVPLCTRKGN